MKKSNLGSLIDRLVMVDNIEAVEALKKWLLQFEREQRLDLRRLEADKENVEYLRHSLNTQFTKIVYMAREDQKKYLECVFRAFIEHLDGIINESGLQIDRKPVITLNSEYLRLAGMTPMPVS